MSFLLKICAYIHICLEQETDERPCAAQTHCWVTFYCIRFTLFGLLSAYRQPGLYVHLLSSWILLNTSVCAVVSSLTLWCLAPESYISPRLYVLRWPALLLCLPISLILFLDPLYSWPPLCHHLLPPPSPTATSNLSELQLSPLCSYRGDSTRLSW